MSVHISGNMNKPFKCIYTERKQMRFGLENRFCTNFQAKSAFLWSEGQTAIYIGTFLRDVAFLSAARCECSFTVRLHWASVSTTAALLTSRFTAAAKPFLRWMTWRNGSSPRRWRSVDTDGLFTLPDIDSVTNSDSDSKPDGRIVLHRNCSQCTDSDSNPDPQSLLYPFLGWISVPESRSESVSGNINKPWCAM